MHNNCEIIISLYKAFIACWFHYKIPPLLMLVGGAVPVPLSETTSGLVEALVVNVRLSLNVVAEVG